MKILALETSTKNFSLAVSDSGKVLKSRHVRLKKVLSSSIIPGIDRILKDCRLKLNDIDGFAVGLGPGSFTSLRVGLATVKGLAFALQKPVVGISSLDILASAFKKTPPSAHICVICDAKRDLLYTSCYRYNEGRVKRESDYLLIGIDEVLKRISEDTVFVGDGIALFQRRIEEAVQAGFEKKKWQAHFTGEKFWQPRADVLAIMAAERFKAKKTDQTDRLTPVYLYPENCQVAR